VYNRILSYGILAILCALSPEKRLPSLVYDRETQSVSNFLIMDREKSVDGECVHELLDSFPPFFLSKKGRRAQYRK